MTTRLLKGMSIRHACGVQHMYALPLLTHRLPIIPRLVLPRRVWDVPHALVDPGSLPSHSTIMRSCKSSSHALRPCPRGRPVKHKTSCNRCRLGSTQLQRIIKRHGNTHVSRREVLLTAVTPHSRRLHASSLQQGLFFRQGVKLMLQYRPSHGRQMTVLTSYPSNPSAFIVAILLYKTGQVSITPTHV